MANEALKELQLAVNNFKEVVDGLAEVKNISENVKAFADNIQQTTKELLEYTDELSISADNMEDLCARSIKNNKQTAQLISDTLKDVQKSIDEIRLQNTNNARELRNNISHAKADLSVKLDGLQTSVDSLLAKSKSDHIFIMIGAVSAAVAAVASIASLFL